MSVLNQYLVPLIMLVAGWLLSRRKTKAEVRGLNAQAELTEIDGTKAIINMWKETCTDLRQQIFTLTNEVVQLRKEVRTLRLENAELRGEDLSDESIQSERPVL